MASSSSPSPQQQKHKDWSRDGFLVSTDPTLLSLSALIAAYNSPAIYWAKALPTAEMRQMIDNSLCFGLYTPTPVPHTDPPASHASSGPNSTLNVPPPSSRPVTPGNEDGPTQIGFARCITDFVTFLYLTDVYVVEEWQGQGLGSWLVQCVQEVVESMPHLRGTLLLTNIDAHQNIAMYERRMKMSRIGHGGRRGSIVERLGRMGSPPRTEEEGGHRELIVMNAKGPGSTLV